MNTKEFILEKYGQAIKHIYNSKIVILYLQIQKARNTFYPLVIIMSLSLKK